MNLLGAAVWAGLDSAVKPCEVVGSSELRSDGQAGGVLENGRYVGNRSLTVAARTGVAVKSIGAATVRERLPDAQRYFHHSLETPQAS
jgi:hypothetical protein